MDCGEQGLRLIKHFEGFRGKPYLCPAKVWTIGYGHTGGVTAATAPIDEPTALMLLQSDVVKFSKTVERLIRVPLTQNQFDALVSFTFNLGGGALQRSTLRQKLNRKDYAGASAEFVKWVRAGGVVSRGLLTRRIAERNLFLAG